ncbi:MAG: HIT family protein [Lentisphaerae bacterium]|nr:HIT family protein [Lentisphaerota bacterium]
MTKNDCIFCKIAEGKLPASKLFEDAHTLAFLDIGPIVKGHTLVIPKRHFDPLTATPPEVLQQLIVTVRRVAEAMTRSLNCDGINVMQSNGLAAGQVVTHIHFHVIPRYATDGHSWNWKAKSYANPGEMQAMAATLTAGFAAPPRIQKSWLP